MKYLNPFLLKETLLETAILLISIFFIQIGLYVCEIIVFILSIFIQSFNIYIS